MGQRKTEKRLKQYAAACRKIVPENRESQIQELLRVEKSLQTKAIAMDSVSYTRGTLWDFILEQIGYLGKYCFIWQIAWIVFFCYMMRHGVTDLFGENNGNAVLTAVSLMPPLLILLTVEEVTKVYQRSMLEIEYATKYSLRSAVMIRMLVLCVMHSLILVICILCQHSGIEANMGRILVYGFTPMTVITALLFKLMQHWQGQLLRSASAGLYVLTAGLIMVGSTERFNWYQPAYLKVWCIVCVIGIASGVRQFVRLNGKLASYEMIVQCGSD
ncbi:MAG: hypothetical protein K2L82_08875 [Lachnospiraceae bacterium]|nr:hypothetical protein [Lachnospiraceae bacterium]